MLPRKFNDASKNTTWILRENQASYSIFTWNPLGVYDKSRDHLMTTLPENRLTDAFLCVHVQSIVVNQLFDVIELEL